MADTIEQKLEKGKAVWEMTQTQGWQIIKSQLEAEIEIETKDLLDCPIEEDTEHKERIKAYKIVLGMVETAEREKEDAAETLRKQ